MSYGRLLVSARGAALVRVLSWVVVIAALTLFVALSERGLKPPDQVASVPAVTAPVATVAGASAERYVVATDAGPVDVTAALARIRAGKNLPFEHDGIVFQNREARLPRRAAGYYREFVLPTPGENGPGARRIIQGQGGEFYLTVDHYGSFLLLE